MTWVADYSSSHPNLAALKAAGCAGIVRYAMNVAGTRFDKQVYQSEIDQAVSLGLTVTVVQESGVQPALGGFQAGVAEARAANARLDRDTSYPKNCWLYYTAEDPNMLPATAWPTVETYFRGVNSVPGRPVGGYGGKALLDHLAGLGLITKKWAVDPWGGHVGCDLAQYAVAVPSQFSNDVDGNLIVSADYGQHPRPQGVIDVTPEEHNLLAAVAAEVDVHTAVDDAGTPIGLAWVAAYALEHARNADTKLDAVKADLDALKAAVAALSGGTVDANAIATAVWGMLHGKLQT